MKRSSKKAEARRITFLVLREAYLWFQVLLMIFPLVFMVLASGKSQLEMAQNPFGLPSSWGQFSANYQSVITGLKDFYGQPVQFYTPYFTMIKNSAVLTLGGLVFLIVCAAPIGYVLGARDFPGKRPFMLFIIFIQTVPRFGYLIAFYYLMNNWNMMNNQLGICIIYAAVSMPSTIIYLKGFYQSFPREIEEAAKLDGAGELQRYLQIVLPVSSSMLFAMLLIQFMGYWNEYAITNMLTTKMSLKTVSITLMSTSEADYTYMMALLVLSALPSLLFFTVFQKRIINSNLTMGAIKG